MYSCGINDYYCTIVVDIFFSFYCAFILNPFNKMNLFFIKMNGFANISLSFFGIFGLRLFF